MQSTIKEHAHFWDNCHLKFNKPTKNQPTAEIMFPNVNVMWSHWIFVTEARAGLKRWPTNWINYRTKRYRIQEKLRFVLSPTDWSWFARNLDLSFLWRRRKNQSLSQLLCRPFTFEIKPQTKQNQVDFLCAAKKLMKWILMILFVWLLTCQVCLFTPVVR